MRAPLASNRRRRVARHRRTVDIDAREVRYVSGYGEEQRRTLVVLKSGERHHLEMPVGEVLMAFGAESSGGLASAPIAIARGAEPIEGSADAEVLSRLLDLVALLRAKAQTEGGCKEEGTSDDDEDF